MATQEEIEYIEHDGVVTSINLEKNSVTVKITDTAECGGCPAAKVCGGAKDTEKITVHTKDASSYKKGDVVVLRGTEQMHRKAIMLATVIPCICMIAMMTGIFIITGSQTTAALCGLGIMLVFYLLLYLCRNKIAHEFSFTISHDGNS